MLINYTNTLYSQFINKLYKIHKIKPTIDTFIFACSYCNKDLFDLCVVEKIIPTIECMYAVCQNYKKNAGYGLILEQLLNMKLLPNERCMSIAISERCANCVKVLLIAGGYINLKLVEEMIGTGYAEEFGLPDLTMYNIQYDEHIYELCHKYNSYPSTLITKLGINVTILKLREMCKTFSIEDINKFMELHKLKYDKYCYDNLLLSANNEKINIALTAANDKIYLIDKISILRLGSRYNIMQLYDKFFKLQ